MTSAQRHGAGHQVSIDLTSMETALAVVSSCVCALRGLGVYQRRLLLAWRHDSLMVLQASVSFHMKHSS